MVDSIYFDIGQSIHSQSNQWYENVQHLGTGGNAVTFLTLCTSGPNKGVLFALKVFRRISDPDRRARFLQEVQFLQGCEHPSVMRVYDSGVFATGGGKYPFVVAEYLPLRLFDVIRAGDATTAHKISYVLQLLSALQYLAALDPAVVHRDIKPQNVFVKGRSCVLGDFGLMKLIDGQAEKDRDIFKESVGAGMPFYYRTPDLISYARNEADISPKSDIFQLGLVVTQLFTGRNPAKQPANPLDELELEQIGHVPGGLGGQVATLLHLMLEFDPVVRPSAADLMDRWQTVFGTARERAHSLDGHVI